MPQTPPQDTTPPTGGPVTLEEGALQLDQIFPAPASSPPAAPKPASRAPAPKPEEPEPAAEPSFDETVDSILEMPPAPTPDAEPIEEEEPEPGAEPVPEPEKFPVVNEDGSIEYVTKDEARGRGLRQADYTRKTQEAAEKRKQAEQLLDAVGKDRERYIEGLKKLETALTETEPDWETLKGQVSQEEYLDRREAFRTRKEAKEKVAAARKEEEAKAAADAQQKWAAYEQQQAEELVQHVPDLGDAEKGPTLMTKMRNAAKQYGFNDQEISVWRDNRVWRMVRDVARLQDIIAARTAIRGKVGAKRTLPPGGQPVRQTARRTTTQRKVDAAMQALRDEGSIQAGAAALDALGM